MGGSLALLLLACVCASAVHRVTTGHQELSVGPGAPLTVDFAIGAWRTVWLWEGEGVDDASVTFTCMLWGIEYIYKPVLVNAAFPVGDIITFTTDCRLRVQIWVLPIGFCSPMTHVYSIAHSLSNTFTLTENISHLCFFFDSPSQSTSITAEIVSKRVNFSASRVELWSGGLEPIPCLKSRCKASVSSRFFVRFVGAQAGMRFLVEGLFQRHDLESVCAREAVPVWDGNLSYTAGLPAQKELFYCDESYVAWLQQRRNWKILATVVVCGAALIRLWFWCQKLDNKGYVPIQFQQPRDDIDPRRGAEAFRKATEL
jgi:hypothetical protein